MCAVTWAARTPQRVSTRRCQPSVLLYVECRLRAAKVVHTHVRETLVAILHGVDNLRKIARAGGPRLLDEEVLAILPAPLPNLAHETNQGHVLLPENL